MFTDIDGLSWMQNLSNMNQLMSEARGDREKMVRWRALQKAFQRKTEHSRGYTTISPETIHRYINMTEDEKIFFDLDTTDKMRRRLRERVPKSSQLYKTIKNLNGKPTWFKCLQIFEEYT